MIIHFPAMYPEFLAGPAPDSALFFDPGLDDEPREKGYRPADLPLDPAKARRLLVDSMQFGQQFKAPGDMVSQALFQEAEDKENAWTIRAEFEQRLKMDAGAIGAAAETDERSAEMAQAQFMLLLAFSTQAYSIELQGLNDEVGEAWEHFGNTLGLDDDEDGDDAVKSISKTFAETNTFDDSPESLPWPWLLGAVAAFVPEGTILSASDADVVAAWNDFDLAFAPAAAELGLPAGWRVASAPAWKLAGKRRAPAGAHWTLELTAALPAE